MNDEYVIVNKESIQKRIEELENKRDSDECSDPRDFSYLCGKIHQLEQVLSLSIPLIPEIEKAINYGIKSFESNAYEMPELIEEIQQDYTSKLILDI